MMDYWALSTHGDPLGKLRKLVKQIWVTANLEGMLVTLNTDNKERTVPRFISDVELIDQLNPFSPLMESNSARLIPGLLASHPDTRIGAILRPCELRALIEMSKLAQLNLDNLVTISIDCLGTLPADEYQWRLERLEKSHFTQYEQPVAVSDDLSQETLAFARQGGIIPYRYRTACQVCSSPAANHAIINLHVIGLPVRQQMLLSTSLAGSAETFHFDKLADGIADETLVLQHERILAKMDERHARTMEIVNESMGTLLLANVDEVVHQLESCGECQVCLDVCPICSVERPSRNTQGHYDRTDVMRWLVSCAGCGMCEQACPDHLPISIIFSHIRQELAQDWNDTAGRSVDEPLPSM
jgi:formate dehydrogenase (coenzyme F420) beta subunit